MSAGPRPSRPSAGGARPVAVQGPSQGPSQGLPPRPRELHRAVPAAGSRTPGRLARLVPHPVWLTRARLLLIGAVVLLLAGLATYAFYFSSWLAVDQLEVKGATSLAVGDIVDVAGVDLGTPLARVDTGAVAERVRGLPEISTVELTRGWPSTLVITIVEREPALVVADGTQFGVYDLAGVEFANPPAAPAGLPVLRVDAAAPTPGTMDAVLSVLGDLPADVRARLVEVRAPTLDSIELRLTEDVLVEWGDAADNARKAQVLVELLVHPASVYNVSAPDVPAIRPLPTP